MGSADATVAGATFTEFEPVVAEIETAAQAALAGSLGVYRDLSGVTVSNAFRRVVRPEVRRRAGTFFTSQELSSLLVKDTQTNGIVLDPACGIGDLLLSHAVRLP